MKYKIFSKASAIAAVNRYVVLGLDTDATPAGYTLDATFEHAAVSNGVVDNAMSHALIQHIRDTMFRVYGIQDMQRLDVSYTASIKPPKVWINPTELLHMKTGDTATLSVVTDAAGAAMELQWVLLDGFGDSLTLTPAVDTKSCAVKANNPDRTTIEIRDQFSKQYWQVQVRVEDPNKNNPRTNTPMGAGQANEPE